MQPPVPTRSHPSPSTPVFLLSVSLPHRLTQQLLHESRRRVAEPARLCCGRVVY